MRRGGRARGAGPWTAPRSPGATDACARGEVTLAARRAAPRSNRRAAASTMRASGAGAIASPSASIARPWLSSEPMPPIHAPSIDGSSGTGRWLASNASVEEAQARAGALGDGRPAERPRVEQVDLERPGDVVDAVAVGRVGRDPTACCMIPTPSVMASRCCRLIGWSGARSGTDGGRERRRRGIVAASGRDDAGEQIAGTRRRPRTRPSAGCRRRRGGRCAAAASASPRTSSRAAASADGEPAARGRRGRRRGARSA